jgi:hypothetical protein
MVILCMQSHTERIATKETGYRSLDQLMQSHKVRNATKYLAIAPTSNLVLIVYTYLT